jgi:hypothetical protein
MATLNLGFLLVQQAFYEGLPGIIELEKATTGMRFNQSSHQLRIPAGDGWGGI